MGDRDVIDKTCTKCNVSKPFTDENFAKEGNGRYRSECRPCGREMCRAYKAKNRKQIADYNKKYKTDKRDDIAVYNKKYYAEHIESEKQRTLRTHTRLREENPSFKMAQTLRSRIYKVFERGTKTETTKTLLGCDFDVFMTWVEYQFDCDMSFDNHGTYWHLDHVLPCASFDLTDPIQQQKCFHWTNLRPLEARENNQKKDKIQHDVIKSHKKVLASFLEEYGECYEGQFTLQNV